MYNFINRSTNKAGQFIFTSIAIVSLIAPSLSFAQSVTYPTLAVNAFHTDNYSAGAGDVRKLTIKVENVSSGPTEFTYSLKLLPVEGAFVAQSANGNISDAYVR